MTEIIFSIIVADRKEAIFYTYQYDTVPTLATVQRDAEKISNEGFHYDFGNGQWAYITPRAILGIYWPMPS